MEGSPKESTEKTEVVDDRVQPSKEDSDKQAGQAGGKLGPFEEAADSMGYYR